ncbi:MAG: glycosyltransferase family 4 protein [Chloroflexi bacterium]|nr:glycosyltransferase family 4 protein [Chloroflexota bacterium]
MHILLIHQAFAALDEPGGTRHHEFARFLVAQGNRVTVIASPISYLTGSVSGKRIRWVDKQVDDLGVTIIRAYTYKALHRSFVHRMFSFLSFMFSSFLIGISVTKVDLVWGTSPPIFQGVTAWVLARIKRVHFIFEVRDLWPAFAVAVGVLRNPVLIRASEWLERFLYRHADKVIVNSPGFVEHMETSGATDIVLVPNGTDTRMFDPKSNGADFRRAHGLNGKFVALYAGAHGLSNDLGVLLEAAKLLEINNEISIVLLGDGKEKAALMAQAKEMSLINVHFISSIPKNEMPEALAAANACIAILKPIPLYGTVYPNKVFDYMAAGRPIILAIDGVVRKLVEDSGGGEFVQPGDSLAVANSIRRMAADPNSSRKMGLAGRAFVGAHFERSSLAQKLLDVMENMMDPPAV